MLLVTLIALSIRDAWNAWLSRVAGYATADLEVVNRTLRVRDQGAAARVAEATQNVRPAPAPTPTVQAPPPMPISENSTSSGWADSETARPLVDFELFRPH